MGARRNSTSTVLSFCRFVRKLARSASGDLVAIDDSKVRVTALTLADIESIVSITSMIKQQMRERLKY
jgi:hypothetical protein